MIQPEWSEKFQHQCSIFPCVLVNESTFQKGLKKKKDGQILTSVRSMGTNTAGEIQVLGVVALIMTSA